MSKYAPAREDGLKPWYVEVWSFGETTTEIKWAETAREAAYQAKGGMFYTYAKARRATVDDMAAA